MNKKVYLLINANQEGYNFCGIYDSREEAERQAAFYNEEKYNITRELYADEPENLERMLEFDKDWSSVIVVEKEMNTRLSGAY